MTERLPRSTLVLAALWTAAMLAWGVARGPLRAGAADAAPPVTPEAAAGSAPGATSAARADDLAALGDGIVVWESARSGSWRIWSRRFAGREERALTPTEPALRHSAPHLSPDGSRLAYLAVAEGRYGEREVGELRVLNIVEPGAPARVVAPRAQTYGAGHRAAVWHSDDVLQFIDESGEAIAVDLTTGARERLAGKPETGAGWLIDAARKHATTGAPTYSVYHADRREVAARTVLGGCEPYFSHDGRWGVWVAGAGGPVYRMDLATRAVTRILSKNDERVAGGRQGYVYFPMPSRDGEALVFGASADEHDHTKGNYDVFLVETDPRTMDLAGPVLRVTVDPGSDRYPDVHLAAKDRARRAERRQRFGVAAAAKPAAPRRTTWPSDREGLVFVFERGDAPNLVGPPGRERTLPLEPRGRARFDHAFALRTAGGSFVATPDGARAVTTGLQHSNELTLEMTLRPDRIEQRGAIVSLAGPRQANFELVQRGRDLVVRLLTAREVRELTVAQLAGVDAPRHFAVTYAPGSLVAYLDGRQVTSSAEFQRDFFQWRPGTFGFGGGGWSGTLSTIALYDRALGPQEIAENARLAVVARGVSHPARVALAATLRARSRLPTLEEIAPYRQAMAVYEYEIASITSADPGAPALRPGERVRVAHWTILDGKTQPEASLADGARVDLVLEPFAAQPQLEAVVVKDTLERPPGAALYLDVRP
jgi:hypothetical protein